MRPQRKPARPQPQIPVALLESQVPWVELAPAVSRKQPCICDWIKASVPQMLCSPTWEGPSISVWGTLDLHALRGLQTNDMSPCSWSEGCCSKQMINDHPRRDSDLPYLRSRGDYNRFIVGHCSLECGLVALYAFQLNKECIQRVHVQLSMVCVQRT